MPRKAEDLTGRVFGTRKVLARAADRRYGGNPTIYWRVRCKSCGTESEVQGASLRRGHGCRICFRGHRPSVPNHDDGRPLTVARLLKLLQDAPARARIVVTMRGRKGYAIEPARREVHISAARVVLITALPSATKTYKRK